MADFSRYLPRLIQCHQGPIMTRKRDIRRARREREQEKRNPEPRLERGLLLEKNNERSN